MTKEYVKHVYKLQPSGVQGQATHVGPDHEVVAPRVQRWTCCAGSCQVSLHLTWSTSFAVASLIASFAAALLFAGTDRTDSDALGRLPHLQRPAASEYTDSMDVDLGTSHGGASQQLTRDSGTPMIRPGAYAVWISGDNLASITRVWNNKQHNNEKAFKNEAFFNLRGTTLFHQRTGDRQWIQ